MDHIQKQQTPVKRGRTKALSSGIQAQTRCHSCSRGGKIYDPNDSLISADTQSLGGSADLREQLSNTFIAVSRQCLLSMKNLFQLTEDCPFILVQILLETREACH